VDDVVVDDVVDGRKERKIGQITSLKAYRFTDFPPIIAHSSSPHPSITLAHCNFDAVMSRAIEGWQWYKKSTSNPNLLNGSLRDDGVAGEPPQYLAPRLPSSSIAPPPLFLCRVDGEYGV
jgi:hypothetical protein